MHTALAISILTNLWNEKHEELKEAVKAACAARPYAGNDAYAVLRDAADVAEGQVSALALALDVLTKACRCEREIEDAGAFLLAAGMGGSHG